MGIMGAVIGLITLVVTIFVIRKLCDLIIVIAFLSALAVPFILGSGGFPEEQIILFALGLGIVMPMITLPLWSISKIMRGGEDKKIEKLKDKEKKDIESMKETYDKEINMLKEQILNLENSIIQNNETNKEIENK